MDTLSSLWSVAAALGGVLLGVLVFIKTTLDVVKLRYEVRTLHDERTSLSQTQEASGEKDQGGGQRIEKSYYHRAVLRWLLVAFFLSVTSLSFVYLKADAAKRLEHSVAMQTEMRAEQYSRVAERLRDENAVLRKELEETRAVLQRHNIPRPLPR